MFRLLFNLFRKKFLKLAFETQSKKNGFEKATRAFVDSNGMSYYQFPNKFEAPVARLEALMQRERRLKFGLDSDAEDLIYDAIEKAINNGKKPDIAEIGYLVKELKRRKGIVFSKDLLLDIVAIYYIREDENPAIFDLDIHNQKIEQFRNDSIGGLKDFFYMSGLLGSLNLQHLTENDLEQLLIDSWAKNTALTQHLVSYTTDQN